MKLRNIALIGLLAVTAASCGKKTEAHDEANHDQEAANVEAPAATYAINTSNSVINWQGDVIGVYFHSGTVNFSEGNISTENGAITGGEFTVDMKNMTTTDSNYQKEGDNLKLLGHLGSDEFFNTEEFPTANFKIRSFENGTLTGDLTIRGITHEEKVENVVIEEKDGELNATGELVFGRRKYDVKWEHYLKDHTLSNDITLKINLTGKAG